ncbi:peptidyl-prolyl cis-trans isomerase G-like [Coregonus clupeaformis]|uniref:peptidyl-prolyl cis-trans isomerase G-like n=1 Tax=Coregonus clupeaformis TaxID=59861 RepID=UPI001E1C91FE|nr:peptidyl-prolyl cis-trans isomerase G-like [Coregonus clupeaformis]
MDPKRYSRRLQYGEASGGWEEYGASDTSYILDPSSRECSKGSLRGSGAPFSPDTDGGVDGDPVQPSVDLELARKKKELEVIEEQIARKKAVLAMRELKHSAKDMPKSQIASTTATGMSKQTKMNNTIIKTYNNVADKSSRIPLKRRVLDIVSKLRRTPVCYLLRKDTPAKVKKQNKMRALELMISASLENEEAHPLRLRVRALTNQRRYPNNEEVVPNDKQHKPTIQRPVHSLRTQEKDIAATGFQRFLNVLNEGVDINKLSKIVNDVNELPVVGEELPQVWPTLLEGNVDSSSRSKSSPPVEEKKKVRLEDEQRYERMQTLLEIVGLDLGVEELGRLTDRTNDRLYGKMGDLKRKENEKGKEKEEREPSFKHLSTSSLPSDSASPSPLLNQHSNMTVEYSSSSNRVWDIDRHRDRSERDRHRHSSTRDKDRAREEDIVREIDKSERDGERDGHRHSSTRERDKDLPVVRETKRSERNGEKGRYRSERDRYRSERHRDRDPEKDRDRSERDRDRYRSERDRWLQRDKRSRTRDWDSESNWDSNSSTRDWDMERSEKDRYGDESRESSIELNSYSMNPIYPVSHPPHASMMATYSPIQYSQYMAYQSSPYTIAFPPGWGYPPGTMPPGTMLPGIMPPGTMPPGFMPPGIMPSGAIPPGKMSLLPSPYYSNGTTSLNQTYAYTQPASNLQLTSTQPASNLQLSSTQPASNLQLSSTQPASNLQLSSTQPASNLQLSSTQPASNLQLSSTQPASPAAVLPLLLNPPICHKKLAPWYTENTRALKQVCRKLERKWCSTKLERYTYIQASSNHHLAYTQPASNRKEKRQKHAEAVAKVSCQMATKKSPSEPWSMKKAKGGNIIFFTGIFMKSYHSHLRKCQYKLKRLAKRRNKAHQHKIKRLLAEAAGKVAPQVAVKDFPFEPEPKTQKE